MGSVLFVGAEGLLCGFLLWREVFAQAREDVFGVGIGLVHIFEDLGLYILNPMVFAIYFFLVEL